MHKLFIGFSFLLAVMPILAQGKLSRRQAVEDIDSLVSLIEEVEVDPYMQLPKETFYAAVAETKNSIPADSIDIFSHFLSLSRLTGMFNQGHLLVKSPDVGAYRGFPLSDVLKVVPGSHDVILSCDAEVEGHKLKRGSKLLSVNGRKTEDMVNTYMPLTSGETDAFRCEGLRSRFGKYMLCENPADTVFDIMLLDVDGKRQNLRLKALPAKEMPRPKKRKDNKSFDYRMLNDSVMLFTFNSCQLNGFNYFVRQMFAEAKRDSVRHLIIDIRENGGGNSATGDEICRYLTDRPFNGFGGSKARRSKTLCLFYKEEFDKDTVYDNTSPSDYNLHLPYDPKFRFDGKTYLLISPRTYSSASNFAWEYWKFVPGTIIGEETGGVNISTGDVITRVLPHSEFRVMVPWKIFYHYGSKDGDPIHGTIPDIPVPADQALTKALQLIEGGR